MNHSLNIMVVEDHDALREITMDALRSEGHHVLGVDSAESLIEQWGEVPIDLLVLDINLPGENGISLARRIRNIQPGIGIVMVTARNRVEEKTEGYDGGADLYLTKPTSFEELNAAVCALGRRLHMTRQHDISLKLDAQRLMLLGIQASVGLTVSETTLLTGLARAPGQRMETWQLIQLLQKDLDRYNKATFEVQIVRLRKKLTQASGESSGIKSIRGVGYQLTLPIALV